MACVHVFGLQEGRSGIEDLPMLNKLKALLPEEVEVRWGTGQWLERRERRSNCSGRYQSTFLMFYLPARCASVRATRHATSYQVC